jgi:signal transduction histidine kinase
VLLESDESGHYVVIADEARIEQVLVNLLRNAVSHSHSSSPIIARVFRAGRSVGVSDPGLRRWHPPEDLSRILDLFFTTATTTHAAGCVGIGLALSKSIVDAHGSSLAAESEG